VAAAMMIGTAVAVVGLPASPAAALAVPSCSVHRGNTAVWMDCEGQGTRYWVRLGYGCENALGVRKNYYTDWRRLDAYASITVSEQCNFKALAAWSDYRDY
jgi:hypothetical protein